MGRGRFNAWPSYVDLFSGLLIAVMGLALIANKERDRAREQTREAEAAQGEVTRAMRAWSDLQASLEERLRASQVEVIRCSEEDICLNISLEYSLNKDQLSDRDRQLVVAVTRALVKELDGEIPAFQGIPRKPFVQVVVEGHSDDTQALLVGDPRMRFKFNWDLSARRASAVLYEMSLTGLGTSQGFNVVSWGRADSDPLCRERAEACRQRNRRTTVRLRFDYKKFQGRGSGKDPGSQDLVSNDG
jgi:flagellar motor protein MotB